MSNENQKLALIPIALLDDCINVIVASQHPKYTFGDLANVVNALNHFKSQAAREDGTVAGASAAQPLGTVGPVEAPAVRESDTSELAAL